MRNSVIALAVTAAAAATLTACGSSDNKSSTASSTTSTTTSSTTGSTTKTTGSACELVTTAQVSAAVGAPVTDGKVEQTQETPYGKYTVCVWSEQGHAFNTVRLSVWEKASAYDAAKTQDDDAKETTGIGEKAFEGSLASIYAVANGHTLFAQYYSSDGTDAEHLPISRAIAKQAAANL